MENNHNNHNNDRGQMLTGMFSDRESTERNYNVLHERGYATEAINLEM